MRCASHQTTRIAAYVVVTMVGAAQPSYSMRSDEANVRIPCKSQKVERGATQSSNDTATTVVVCSSMIPDESAFGYLASEWKTKRNGTLSLNLARDPAYLRIIGMGEKALPFLFERLRAETDAGEPDHWFAALWAITGENPVKEESQGRIHKMATDWLTWGASRGY